MIIEHFHCYLLHSTANHVNKKICFQKTDSLTKSVDTTYKFGCSKYITAETAEVYEVDMPVHF